MSWCTALLLHVNLLLCVLCGAALATAARLKWDPSTYIVVRELFPTEYRACAAALCACAGALLALAHLAAAACAGAGTAPPAPRTRRALLLTYAALVTAVVCFEAACAAWLGARAAAWLRSEAARRAAQALQARRALQPLLRLAALWCPLPARMQDLMQEAEADAPRNLYVLGACAALAAALQAAAVLLALLAARRARRVSALPPAPPAYCRSSMLEKAPLRTAFRGGKLVVL